MVIGCGSGGSLPIGKCTLTNGATGAQHTVSIVPLVISVPERNGVFSGGGAVKFCPEAAIAQIASKRAVPHACAIMRSALLHHKRNCKKKCSPQSGMNVPSTNLGQRAARPSNPGRALRVQPSRSSTRLPLRLRH